MINDKVINYKGIIDLIYPIGSIYISVNSTSPATLFGGTWEQIKDKFILSAGDTYGAGTTGGSAKHTHTYSHTHGVPGVEHTHTISHTHGVPGVAHTHDLDSNGWAYCFGFGGAGSIFAFSATRKTGLSYKAFRFNNGTTIGVTDNATVDTATALGGKTASATPGSATTNSQSTTTSGKTTPTSTTTNSQSSSTTSETSNMPPYLAVYMWKRTA